MMLSAVFGRWYFENISDTQKRLLSVSICDHLVQENKNKNIKQINKVKLTT